MATSTDLFDRGHMATALSLARRGLGRVAPNPAVGCVIVKAGRVVGRGWTQPGGRPHAETEALQRAGAATQGATAYVSLEPCAHQGKTGPCAQALIEAGIRRCVIALEDPDDRVSGKGIAMLRQAGIEVEVGLLAEEARKLNAGFITRVLEERPTLTLKLALSLDGRIAAPTGQSQWITGPAARQDAHRLRSIHDAVMVGSGTALADDPKLTVRLPGFQDRQPLRVVMDGRLRLSMESHLVREAGTYPTFLATASSHDDSLLRPYREQDVTVEQFLYRSHLGLDLDAVLEALAKRGITRLMVEGGGGLAAGLLAAELIDQLVIYSSGLVLGGDGVPGIAPLGLDHVDQGQRFRLISECTLGEDAKRVYERR